MAQYVEVTDAIKMPGLRVVLTPGVPGPWSEAAKAILHVKGLPYVKVRQELLGANLPLLGWTAQATAPVAVWNDEPPRCTWIEQLYLFERLAPAPRLIPQDMDERMLMFALANEVFGENGFVWNRRHIMVRDFSGPDQPDEVRESFRFLGQKYWYGDAAAAAAPGRCAEVLGRLADRLRAQRDDGSRYCIGRSITALDIYCACAFALVEPLPQDQCEMGALFRSVYTTTDPVVRAAADPVLREHRDFIYAQHLELPVDL
jgi:glutathione S-transferase